MKEQYEAYSNVIKNYTPGQLRDAIEWRTERLENPIHPNETRKQIIREQLVILHTELANRTQAQEGTNEHTK